MIVHDYDLELARGGGINEMGIEIFPGSLMEAILFVIAMNSSNDLIVYLHTRVTLSIPEFIFLCHFVVWSAALGCVAQSFARECCSVEIEFFWHL